MPTLEKTQWDAVCDAAREVRRRGRLSETEQALELLTAGGWGPRDDRERQLLALDISMALRHVEG